MSGVKNVNRPQRFAWGARIKAFGYAMQGIGFMLKTQHNAWLHFIATLSVAALGAYFRVGVDDWRWLIAVIALVWMAEALNTAVEYLCDVVSPEYSEAVKHAKDIAAGGVLLAAVAALLIGAITLGPYLTPHLLIFS